MLHRPVAKQEKLTTTMAYMKLSFYLMVVITLSLLTSGTASRPGEKIHFQDSSELEELDIDKRPEPQRDNRNHRGRSIGNQKKDKLPEFEQGIPGVYPIRGPAQAPLMLPPHTGRGIGLQNNKSQEQQSSQPVQQPLGHRYAGNPFLSKISIASASPANPTTNKYNPPIFPGVTNQLPTSDKPSNTTPYGSNQLLEDPNREGKVEATTNITFGDRGLLDTAPHCRPGQILVENKCRTAV